ncbi:hypothetical protein ACTAJO_000562 [Vibrio fluvialis]
MTLTKALTLIATLLAALFAGVQTFSSVSFFNEKKVQYDFKNVAATQDMTGDISDILISLKTPEGYRTLNNPLFFDLIIKNTGSVDLAKTDFEGNLSFTFSENSTPVKFQQIDQSHASLQPDISINDKTLNIAPLMLNSGDFFTIRILLEGGSTSITPHLRLLGMKEEISKIKDNPISSSSSIFYTFIFLLSLFYTAKTISIGVFYEQRMGVLDNVILFILLWGVSLSFVDNIGFWDGKLSKLIIAVILLIVLIIYFHFNTRSEDENTSLNSANEKGNDTTKEIES